MPTASHTNFPSVACLTSYKGYCLAVWEASGLIYTLISDGEAWRLAQIVATLSRA